MRKYVAVPLLVLLATALTAAGADVSGTWKGTFTPQDRDPGPALVILKQTGDAVTGTAGPNEADRNEITNGKVTGDKVTFEVKREEGATMKFVLTLDGDTLEGMATRERDGQQETAKLSLRREK